MPTKIMIWLSIIWINTLSHAETVVPQSSTIIPTGSDTPVMTNHTQFLAMPKLVLDYSDVVFRVYSIHLYLFFCFLIVIVAVFFLKRVIKKTPIDVGIFSHFLLMGLGFALLILRVKLG